MDSLAFTQEDSSILEELKAIDSDPFGASAELKLRSLHSKITRSYSRLLGIRSLIGRLARERIVDADVHQYQGRVQERYLLGFSKYTLTVLVSTVNHTCTNKRAIPTPQSALAINRMLKDMGVEWMRHENETIS